MSDMLQKPKISSTDEKSLGNLLKLAGERPEIPLSVESRVRHRVQEEWRASTAQPDAQKVYSKVHKTWRRGALWAAVLRWTLPMGVAAAGLLVAVMVSQPVPVPGELAATVARVVGDGQAAREYPVGSQLYAGDIISTGPDEGLSLVLARSESLRVDANTELRVVAKDHFALLRGRVYADSGRFVYRDGGLIIDTDFGSITDVGTQFAVTTDHQHLDVAVREGRVNVSGARNDYVAMVGERLTIATGQDAVVETIAAYDDYWNWVGALTPEFDMTHKSLLDFLNWAARETGRELIIKGDQMQMDAMRTMITVPIDGLTPQQALPAILSVTTVQYSIEADKIVIER